MENVDAVKQAEAHLEHALTDLKNAENAERSAEREIEEAREELKEALHPHEILLEIATPKGMFRGIFRLSGTIAEVIQLVVDQKHLDPKDTFELVHGETVLQPTSRTLESFGLKCKADLELVATGSGV
jgi:exonuclease VII small subunit